VLQKICFQRYPTMIFVPNEGLDTRRMMLMLNLDSMGIID